MDGQNANRIILSERFTKFNVSYPVIVKGWDIICDQNNKRFLKIKFQKICSDILAFKLDIVCLNSLDEKVATYSDYNVKEVYKRNINFLEKIPLDDSTEKVSVYLKQYVLTDATIGPADSNNEIIEYEFKRFKRRENDEAAKRIIKTATGLPIDKGTHWYCTCGKLNGKNAASCISCKCDKETVFKKITKENVLAEKQAYNTQKEESAKKRRKFAIKFASVISAIAVVAIVISILCATVFPMPSVTVNELEFQKNNNGTYTLKNCNSRNEHVEIPSKVRGKEVTSISGMAFTNTYNLSSVTLPDSLLTIEDNAFYNSSLREIKIPSSVLTVGENAFEDCQRLKKVELPEGLVELGDSAFDNCHSLEEIILPSTLKKIGAYAFTRCSSLKKIIIPGSVISVGHYAFYGCDNLTIFCQENPDKRWNSKWNGYNLPVIENYYEEGETENGFKWASTTDKNVTIYQYVGEEENLTVPATIDDLPVVAICNKVFKNNLNLTSVELPDALTEIGESLFENCENLSKINIPNNCVKINQYAFSNCKNLTEIDIPLSVQYISANAFATRSSITVYAQAKEKPEGWQNGSFTSVRSYIWDCKEHGETTDGFKWKLTGDDIVNIYDYIGTSDIVTVPASINGYYVDVLDGAFENCNKLTDVTFSPDCRITILGNHTFSNCINLKNIVLPDSLTEIGSSAFNSCNSLTYLAIPKNVKYIGNQVFSYCSNLPYIYLPDGLEKIGFRAFENCRKLKYIFIPDSVSDINFGLFSNTLDVNIFCQAQSKPDGWDDNWNSNNPNVTWGCSDYGITEDGFVWIEKDEDVRILDNIGSSSNLNIPAKVNGKYFTSIADKAFYNRNDVKSLEFDADSKIHTIGEQAFYYCENLTTVSLPNSLVAIKNSAFNRCRFSQIIIPLSVTEIQEYAFSNNSSLKYIYCEASQKPDNWASNWYSGYNATVRWGYTGD